MLLIHAGLDGYIFFREEMLQNTQACYLRGTLRRQYACGGAYLIRCWGVVQSVGHLTVNEDGGGSNPPAPANFPL